MVSNRITNFLSCKSIEARSAKGSIWVAFGSVAEHGTRFLRNMILTRILAPEAFGLMAILMVVNSVFQASTEIGIKEAIIQNPNGRDKTFLNAAWWLSVCRAILIYTILFLTAPLIAEFYGNAELKGLLRLAFLSVLLNGAISPMAHVAVKNMSYPKWVLFFNGGGIMGALTAVGFSFLQPNVFALLLGFIAENVFRIVLSYFLFPYSPGIAFTRENTTSLLKFASGMFGLPILTIIFMKADIFAVGKICSMSELGLYSMAVAVAWMPFEFITMVSSRIMMPAFSEKQSDYEWINKWVVNITSIIVFWGMPILIFSFFYGPEVLAIIYGDKYAEVSRPFTIMIMVALLRTSSVPIASVYLAMGRPKLHRNFVAIRTMIIVIIIIPMTKNFGIVGASSSALLAMFISFLVQLLKMKKLTGINLFPYFIVFSKGLSVSLIIFAVWFIFGNYSPQNLFLSIVPGLLSCLAVYVLLTWNLFVRFKSYFA